MNEHDPIKIPGPVNWWIVAMLFGLPLIIPPIWQAYDEYGFTGAFVLYFIFVLVSFAGGSAKELENGRTIGPVWRKNE